MTDKKVTDEEKNTIREMVQESIDRKLEEKAKAKEASKAEEADGEKDSDKDDGSDDGDGDEEEKKGDDDDDEDSQLSESMKVQATLSNSRGRKSEDLKVRNVKELQKIAKTGKYEYFTVTKNNGEEIEYSISRNNRLVEM